MCKNNKLILSIQSRPQEYSIASRSIKKSIVGCKINDILTSKSVYKHQNDESGEINVQISVNRNHKFQNTNSLQNGGHVK